MPVPKKLGAMKRFGARYGRSLKQRFIEVENLQRKHYKCPYCSTENVKRQSMGVWQCSKCSAKFASKAYTITKKKTARELAAEVMAVEGTAKEESIKEEEEDIIEKIPA